MNVKIKVQFYTTPTLADSENVFDAASHRTNDADSIVIYSPSGKTNELIVEFTINKAKQIDVVDSISREFKCCIKVSCELTISFPDAAARKKIKKKKSQYTVKQGQYLAFIYYYTKLHGYAPAEADMQQYFRCTPPRVHNMVLQLEKKGLIERKPKTARSIKLLLSRDKLPDLE